MAPGAPIKNATIPKSRWWEEVLQDYSAIEMARKILNLFIRATYILIIYVRGFCKIKRHSDKIDWTASKREIWETARERESWACIKWNNQTCQYSSGLEEHYVMTYQIGASCSVHGNFARLWYGVVTTGASSLHCYYIPWSYTTSSHSLGSQGAICQTLLCRGFQILEYDSLISSYVILDPALL